MKKDTLLKKLGRFVKVRAVQTNQTEIIFENGVALQSYDSLVAVRLKTDGVLYVGEDYNYSVTTSKYINKVFGATSKEIANHIAQKNPNFKLIK